MGMTMLDVLADRESMTIRITLSQVGRGHYPLTDS